VEAVGPVPSAGDFLRGLSLLLFPLERGSGMKVKVLEAIASGLPVVTTPAGAEGVDGGDGVVVETSTPRLAAAAARLLVDDAERRERGTAARAAFERRYTPRVATEPIAELYARMA
jgi:glycosyltransferase involved in cell wall biosynthesis